MKEMVCRTWAQERVPLNSQWLIFKNGDANFHIVGLLILYSKNMLGLC